MARPNPFVVLGVEPGASGAAIKAAWRRLARQHHPDLTGSDPAAARSATRQMAEINAAYEELREPERRQAATQAAEGAGRRAAGGRTGAGPEGTGPSGAGAAGPFRQPGARAPGPPRPRPVRPVTARFDTSETFTPRNQTLSHGGRPLHTRVQPPPRPERARRDLLRASEPTGPLRRARARGFRPAPPPDLAAAEATAIEFGKFRGHTLGEVAAFEPSYIDWISDTITRDVALVAAARVVREDLDQRGIARPRRGVRPGTPRL